MLVLRLLRPRGLGPGTAARLMPPCPRSRSAKDIVVLAAVVGSAPLERWVGARREWELSGEWGETMMALHAGTSHRRLTQAHKHKQQQQQPKVQRPLAGLSRNAVRTHTAMEGGEGGEGSGGNVTRKLNDILPRRPLFLLLIATNPLAVGRRPKGARTIKGRPRSSSAPLLHRLLHTALHPIGTSFAYPALL